jgi:hypothetical protein
MAPSGEFIATPALSRSTPAVQKNPGVRPAFPHGPLVPRSGLSWAAAICGGNPGTGTRKRIGHTPLLACDLGYTYAAVGKTREAREIIGSLQHKAKPAYVSPYLIAAIHGALGEKDQAFQLLKRAYSERDSHLTNLPLDSKIDPLRTDPRFPPLIERLKLSKQEPAQ